MLGIAAFGGYVPPLRTSREEIAATHAWVNPGLRSGAKGKRSVAGWDEDSVTMAVDAARDALTGFERRTIDGVFLGSTTLPFADRLNSGVVAAALGLGEEVTAQDITCSQRAGTGALRSALEAAAARKKQIVAIAAEKRSAPAATSAEMVTGHGAAAVIVGPGEGVARLLGSASLTVDFVDHFRGEGSEFDYQWEERWVREEGYLKIVPRAIKAALAKAGLEPAQIDHFALACPLARVDKAVARAAQIPDTSVADNLAANCGDTGAAHALVLLVNVLERASPGQRILVAGFGQGVDVLIFETTEALPDYQKLRTGVTRHLDHARPCSYPRYMVLNDLVKIDRGIRAETDKGTALTAHYRHNDLFNALVGGRCRQCGTHQVPRLRICVNPDCRAVDSQEPHSFAESRARVVSWSADTLTYTPDPPAYYGMVDFEEGGRLMIDFTGIGEGGVEVGSPMRMVFRIKDRDNARGFTRYFWKAAPAEPAEPREA